MTDEEMQKSWKEMQALDEEMIRTFGDIDVAEDAVQEAFAVALRKWPVDGPPPNPGGWITTTARNRAIDRRRREERGHELLSDAVLSPRSSDLWMPKEVGGVDDDRLRLIFTCCNPALSTEAQVALTLRLLGGLTTDEVARAFIVTEPTMAQRLVRQAQDRGGADPVSSSRGSRAARPLAARASRRLPHL